MPANPKTLELLVSSVLNAPKLEGEDFRRIVLTALISKYRREVPICLNTEEEGLPTIVLKGQKYIPIPKEQAFDILKYVDRRNLSPVIFSSEMAFIIRYCERNNLGEKEMESLTYLQQMLRENPGKSISEIFYGDTPEFQFVFLAASSKTAEYSGISQMYLNAAYRNRIAEIYIEKIHPMLRMLN
jgi:hypothetical protein